MTASIFAQYALLGVLVVIAGFTIPALLQVRRTARAVEDLVRAVAPGAAGAATHLDSVLGRVDRAFEGVESGTRSVAGTFAGLGAFVRGLRQPGGGSAVSSWLAALSSIFAGMSQAWTVVSSRRSEKAAQAHSTKEGGHENV